MRSAICSGVPISWVRKPSLYWTRSSNDESAHMPFLSPVELPACWTAPRKPSTAGLLAFSMISRRVSFASFSVSLAMMKPLSPTLTSRPDGAGVVADLDDLLGDAVEVLAVGEVPVGVEAAVAPRGGRVAALEDLRVGPLRGVERLGLQREVVDAVEVAAEVHVVLGPDLAQHLEELGAAAVALVVLEPRLAQVGELVLEPAGDDVDGEPAAATGGRRWRRAWPARPAATGRGGRRRSP